MRVSGDVGIVVAMLDCLDSGGGDDNVAISKRELEVLREERLEELEVSKAQGSRSENDTRSQWK